MKNEYHKDIVDILLNCGQEGMKVKNIARHIYNMHYGLFATNVVFDNIYNQIRFYLCRQVCLKRAPFMRTRWGYYTIKPDYAIQLDFTLDLLKEEPAGKASKNKPTEHTVQLSLFPVEV